MRFVIASLALLATAAATSVAEARCEACPQDFTFWHSKDACVADNGSGATSPPLYWKKDMLRDGAPLYGRILGGRSGGKAGPADDR